VNTVKTTFNKLNSSESRHLDFSKINSLHGGRVEHILQHFSHVVTVCSEPACIYKSFIHQKTGSTQKHTKNKLK